MNPQMSKYTPMQMRALIYASCLEQAAWMRHATRAVDTEYQCADAEILARILVLV